MLAKLISKTGVSLHRFRPCRHSTMNSTSIPERIACLPRHPDHPRATFLAAERCDVVFASYSAGQSIAPHTHETMNCGVITAGEMILTKNGIEARYTPGDWYEIPAGCVHSSRFEVHTASVEFYFS